MGGSWHGGLGSNVELSCGLSCMLRDRKHQTASTRKPGLLRSAHLPILHCELLGLLQDLRNSLSHCLDDCDAQRTGTLRTGLTASHIFSGRFVPAPLI